MIAQILNRSFVLNQLNQVQAFLAEPDERRGPESIPEELRVDAAAELARAGAAELAASSGQRGQNPDHDVRERRVIFAEAGPSLPQLDDTAFISHDPIVSNLQSALEQVFLESGRSSSEPPADEGRRGGDGVSPIGAVSLAGCPIETRDDGRRLFGAFQQTDPRWVASLVAMGISKFKNPHAFNPQRPAPFRIGNRARLLLVGDWGSGLPRAQAIGAEMRRVIDQGKAAGLDQHVIHLGDVYYSGWEREYEKNFLPYWPVQPGEQSARLTSWCLNGNHDMYSGGHAYFRSLLAKPLFAPQAQSSFFTLINDSWDILGLDTAHEDEGLRDPQLEWVKETLQGSTRRSMLLSHHQLFSAYEKPCEALRKKIGPFLAQRPVDVWFWGHEHRCVFYKEHQGVRHARLIGHGGVPVYMYHADNHPYPPPAYYEYRKYIPGFIERWAYFGFAVVDLDGPKARVRYIDEFGTTHHTEDLP